MEGQFLVVITESHSNDWGKSYYKVTQSFVMDFDEEEDVSNFLSKYQYSYSVDIFNWDGKKTTPLSDDQNDYIYSVDNMEEESGDINLISGELSCAN